MTRTAANQRYDDAIVASKEYEGRCDMCRWYTFKTAHLELGAKGDTDELRERWCLHMTRKHGGQL